MGKVTLKIVQKYESKVDGKRNVRLRITADRTNRYVSTAIYVTASSFNPKGKRENGNWIKANHPNHGPYNRLLSILWDKAVGVLAELGQQADVEAVQLAIETPSEADGAVSLPVFPCFRAFNSAYLKRRGQSVTTDSYVHADNAFGRFLAQLPVPLQDVRYDQLTTSFVKEWRNWVLTTFANNTAWLYHARLKSFYYQAVEDIEGLASLPAVVTEPFKRVKVPKKQTRKERLYEDEIERLLTLELPWGKLARRSRDICLLMYYAHGMRVGDALRLRLSNYVIIHLPAGDEHRLIYTMGKTGKPKNVLLPQQAITILTPYRATATSPEATLFPFLNRSIDAGYDEYNLQLKIKSKVALIRNGLIQLTKLAGIDKGISAHIFRHSFADLARRSKMDVVQIQKALGHDQISTTLGYLDELDQSSVDEVKSLFK